MPTRSNTNFARMKDCDEFESLLCDICALEWRDPHTKKNGRKGQRQKGVDIYGQPKDLNGIYRGVQCKLRTTDASLTEAQIEEEIKKARSFPHKLDKLILATDAPRDANTQILVDKINQREIADGNFEVAVWFWDAITERLAAYPSLIVKYYAEYFANLTTLPIVEKLVNRPLTALFFKLGSSNPVSIEELLQLHGISILSQDAFASTQQLGWNDTLPDGVICQYISSPEVDDPNILQFTSQVHAYTLIVEKDCPIFVILPASQTTQFLAQMKMLNGDVQRVSIRRDELPIVETARQIFGVMFEYGYCRRGSLPTIQVCARTTPARPSSAFLDLDWRPKLSTKHFPTPEIWEETLVPVIEDVVEKITSPADRVRIQITSTLPLPAAFAVGFFLNLRVARVGVWARDANTSDFKQQFWLSDNKAKEMLFHPEQLTQATEDPQTAIVELTTFTSIHKAVKNFARHVNLNPDMWIEIPIGENISNITEEIALAYANQVGSIIRCLNEQGITDVHMFARMPSALGILIGQRLQACGRIHLYWFDNPTYRYAFTLK
ncbi:MAG: SAVED domain-containing protein [Anaerolineae bacterium]|nr:SAVED domain-containing protein [Anaerolineae bacterium]